MTILTKPHDIDALMQNIQVHFAEGHLQRAEETLDQALQIEPTSVAFLMLRALARSRRGLWEPAQADFSAARALDPDDSEAWLGEALCLAARNEIYAAMERFEAMTARFPHYIRGHIQAARFYFKLVVLPRGRSHLEAAMAADPNQAQRREIEAMLKEQAQLDKKRCHRPDFDALRRAKAARAGL